MPWFILFVDKYAAPLCSTYTQFFPCISRLTPLKQCLVSLGLLTQTTSSNFSNDVTLWNQCWTIQLRYPNIPYRNISFHSVLLKQNNPFIVFVRKPSDSEIIFLKERLLVYSIPESDWSVRLIRAKSSPEDGVYFYKMVFLL